MNWLSVKEFKPIEGDKYLISSSDGYVFIGYVNYKEDKNTGKVDTIWTNNDGITELKDVSHFCPIYPTPPSKIAKRKVK